MFKRAEIANNDAFDAGGHALGDGHAVRGAARRPTRARSCCSTTRPRWPIPKKAFTENPYAEAEVDLTFTGQGRPTMFGGEPDEPHEKPGEEFAKGHYEQLVAGTGTIRVGDGSGPSTASACATTRGVRATGRRPGTTAGSPRTSAATSASWGAASPAATATAPAAASSGRTASCTSATRSRSRTEYEGDDQYHETISAVLRSSRSDKEWKVSGRVMNLIPLRNRRTTPTATCWSPASARA